MAQPVGTSDAFSSPGATPLQRCCAHHADWTQLSQHLLDEFPEVALGEVVRELRKAKDAVENVALDNDDALRIGELIARHQLLVISGRVEDVARLDPERHVRA